MNNKRKITLPQTIVPLLLDWFAGNARVLPWRKNRDPYRIWISEIMLQQTRVEAVIPYYERFLAALPDIRSLAKADDDKLMKLWQGLGYYSRARNLKRAAQKIMEEFGGIFPSEPEQILSLHGIGTYTAGAIASIAFEKPVPAVDGNVLRVLSRIMESKENIDLPAVRQNFTEQLRAIYPEGKCGAFTQSLMELGALICLPNGAPLCGSCPLASLCRAFRNGTWNTLPVRTEKKSRRVEEKTVLMLFHEDEIALKKRPAKGLLAGLYEFPNREGFLTPEQLKKENPDWEIDHSPLNAVHIFTHVEWRMRGYRIRCAEKDPEYLWVTREQLKEQFSIPSAFKAFLIDAQGIPSRKRSRKSPRTK